MCVRAHVCACECVCVHVGVCVHTCMCLSVCAHACVSMYVCTHMHMRVQESNLISIQSVILHIITDSGDAKEIFQQFDQCSNSDRTGVGLHSILYASTTTGN